MAVNDVIQITDESHPWFPALLIVDEVKSWGVTAFALMPSNNSEPGSCTRAYNRLKDGQFEIVGVAAVVPSWVGI